MRMLRRLKMRLQLAFLVLFGGCTTVPGHWASGPFDAVACAKAAARAAAAQAPCDKKKPDPAACLAGALQAAAELAACIPPQTWVPDPPAAPVAK